MAAIDSYTVFDFETTGLDPHSDRIIQVGLCEVRGGQVTRQADWLVNQNVTIPSGASRIHGITTDVMRRDGVAPERSLRVLLDALAQAPAGMGHNIHRFDVLFLEQECRRLGMPMPRVDDYVDTAALFKGHRMGDRRSPRETHREYADRVLSIPVRGLKYSVSACMEHLRISRGSAQLHSAGGDTYCTHLIYQSLCGRV